MNIIKEGNRHTFINDLEIINHLETGNYVFNYDPKSLGTWLEKTENFTFPSKVYDIDTKLIRFVSEDFNQTKDNLGVLLVGRKGQGKSLTAKQLAKKLNLPVIIIKDKIPNNVEFIGFLNRIKQDYVLFVDEFEKLFANSYSNDVDNNYHDQTSFLSFMDGAISKENKILFLLTSNDEVSEFLINRPSRIKYLKEYVELSDDILNEIIEDRLINKEYKNDLINNVSLVNLNVDLLISIINNINQFDMPFSEFSDIFNYQFENYKYEISLIDESGNKTSNNVMVLSYKPKLNDDDLFGYVVMDMITFTNDLIVFNTYKYDRGKGINDDVRKNYMLEAKRLYGSVPFTLTA